MYRLLVEELPGLRREVNTLWFSPLLPAEWDGYTLHYVAGSWLCLAEV